MPPTKPSADVSREAVVSLALRQCALRLDPRYGRLSVLAEALDLHESTLGVWVRSGRIPKKPCRRLLKQFGKALVNFDLLVQK